MGSLPLDSYFHPISSENGMAELRRYAEPGSYLICFKSLQVAEGRRQFVLVFKYSLGDKEICSELSLHDDNNRPNGPYSLPNSCPLGRKDPPPEFQTIGELVDFVENEHPLIWDRQNSVRLEYFSDPPIVVAALAGRNSDVEKLLYEGVSARLSRSRRPGSATALRVRQTFTFMFQSILNSRRVWKAPAL